MILGNAYNRNDGREVGEGEKERKRKSWKRERESIKNRTKNLRLNLRPIKFGP